METFCDLKQKEVINVCDGFRFGYVNNLRNRYLLRKNNGFNSACAE